MYPNAGYSLGQLLYGHTKAASPLAGLARALARAPRAVAGKLTRPRLAAGGLTSGAALGTLGLMNRSGDSGRPGRAPATATSTPSPATPKPATPKPATPESAARPWYSEAWGKPLETPLRPLNVQKLLEYRRPFGRFGPTPADVEAAPKTVTPRTEFSRYYQHAPGGFDRAVELAQRAAKDPNRPPLMSMFGRWKPEDVDAQVPVTWRRRLEASPLLDKVPDGIWRWRTPEQPHGRIELAATDRTDPWDRVTLEHELTHALTATPDGSVPLYDIAPRGGSTPGERPADAPERQRYMRYMTSPIELDPRLAEIKRHWVHATGRQMETPDDAREALEAAMRVSAGVQPDEKETHYGPQWQADQEWRAGRGRSGRLPTPEEVKRLKRIHLLEQYHAPDRQWLRNHTTGDLDDMLQWIEQNPSVQPIVIQRLLELVQNRQPPGLGAKLAAVVLAR